MADNPGWMKMEKHTGRFYQPQDAVIYKVITPEDRREWIMLGLQFLSVAGDDEQEIMIFMEDAMKFVRLIASRCAGFGDPTAQKVLTVFQENWGPRPPRDE